MCERDRWRRSGAKRVRPQCQKPGIPTTDQLVKAPVTRVDWDDQHIYVLEHPDEVGEAANEAEGGSLLRLTLAEDGSAIWLRVWNISSVRTEQRSFPSGGTAQDESPTDSLAGRASRNGARHASRLREVTVRLIASIGSGLPLPIASHLGRRGPTPAPAADETR